MGLRLPSPWWLGGVSGVGPSQSSRSLPELGLRQECQAKKTLMAREEERDVTLFQLAFILASGTLLTALILSWSFSQAHPVMVLVTMVTSVSLKDWWGAREQITLFVQTHSSGKWSSDYRKVCFLTSLPESPIR